MSIIKNPNKCVSPDSFDDKNDLYTSDTLNDLGSRRLQLASGTAINIRSTNPEWTLSV